MGAMLGRNAGRAAMVALSLSLLVSVPATAQDPEVEVITIPPPNLGLAVASLLAGEGTVAGTIKPAKMRLPECRYVDIPTRYGKVRDWQITLLDTNLKLRKGYKPKDLVPVSRAGIKGSGLVRKVMIKDLRALTKAARKKGKALAVRSAYRSYQTQVATFNMWVARSGYAQALKFSARPGHSEHQMGTTVDFTTAPGVPLNSTFGKSPAGKWLAKNGWKFGFIMSYPQGKKKVSCYGYEPWHFRYFGRDLARQIHESGQVPRRFLYENYEAAP